MSSTGCTRTAARRSSTPTNGTSSSRRSREAERGDLVEAFAKRLTAIGPRRAAERGQGVEQMGRRHRDPASAPRGGRGIHRPGQERSPSPGSRTITWPTTAGSKRASCCATRASSRASPGVIVQGRHDCCTPPIAAWQLKKAWPEVELNIVPDGGHLYNEPGVLDGLIRATDKFAGRLSYSPGR